MASNDEYQQREFWNNAHSSSDEIKVQIMAWQHYVGKRDLWAQALTGDEESYQKLKTNKTT